MLIFRQIWQNFILICLIVIPNHKDTNFVNVFEIATFYEPSQKKTIAITNFKYVNLLLMIRLRFMPHSEHESDGSTKTN